MRKAFFFTKKLNKIKEYRISGFNMDVEALRGGVRD